MPVSVTNHLNDWIQRVRPWAEAEEHHMDMTHPDPRQRDDLKTRMYADPTDLDGDGNPKLKSYRSMCRFSERLPSWETRISFVYTVDKAKSQANPGTFELWRHLCCQVSVPASLTQGELNAMKPEILHMFEPVVQAMWPLREGVRFSLNASAPIPVHAPGSGELLHFRTPVIAHFLVSHDTVEGIAGSGTTETMGDSGVGTQGRVVLFGPDGRPLKPSGS